MSDIKINYKWDKDTFLKANKAIYDFDMKHSSKRFVGWFFIALTQFGVVGALKHNVFGLLVISTILVVYWYGFRWRIRKNILLRGFEKSSVENSLFNIAINDSGISINETLFEWENIKNVTEVKNGFLVNNEKKLLFICNDNFTDKDMKNFKKILKSKQKI